MKKIKFSLLLTSFIFNTEVFSQMVSFSKVFGDVEIIDSSIVEKSDTKKMHKLSIRVGNNSFVELLDSEKRKLEVYANSHVYIDPNNGPSGETVIFLKSGQIKGNDRDVVKKWGGFLVKTRNTWINPESGVFIASFDGVNTNTNLFVLKGNSYILGKNDDLYNNYNARNKGQNVTTRKYLTISDESNHRFTELYDMSKQQQNNLLNLKSNNFPKYSYDGGKMVFQNDESVFSKLMKWTSNNRRTNEDGDTTDKDKNNVQDSLVDSSNSNNSSASSSLTIEDLKMATSSGVNISGESVDGSAASNVLDKGLTVGDTVVSSEQISQALSGEIQASGTNFDIKSIDANDLSAEAIGSALSGGVSVGGTLTSGVDIANAINLQEQESQVSNGDEVATVSGDEAETGGGEEVVTGGADEEPNWDWGSGPIVSPEDPSEEETEVTDTTSGDDNVSEVVADNDSGGLNDVTDTIVDEEVSDVIDEQGLPASDSNINTVVTFVFSE